MAWVKCCCTMNIIIAKWFPGANQVVHQTDQVVHQTDHVVHQTDQVVHQTDQVVHQTNQVVHTTPERPSKNTGSVCIA